MHRGLIENPELSISMNTFGMWPGHSENKPWFSEGSTSRGINGVLFTCYRLSLQS